MVVQTHKFFWRSGTGSSEPSRQTKYFFFGKKMDLDRASDLAVIPQFRCVPLGQTTYYHDLLSCDRG